MNHLGGYMTGEIGDPATYYPNMWKYVIDKYHIKSVLDVGCGMGISCSFFKNNGCSVIGIEGDPLCKENSNIKDSIITHDYTIGKTNIEQEFDLSWCCEFLEHVDAQFIDNYMTDFTKCKLILITHAFPGQAGHHHVNLQNSDYWIDIFKKYNLYYNHELTNELRDIAVTDWQIHSPNHKSHFVRSGLVFNNIESRKI